MERIAHICGTTMLKLAAIGSLVGLILASCTDEAHWLGAGSGGALPTDGEGGAGRTTTGGASGSSGNRTSSGGMVGTGGRPGSGCLLDADCPICGSCGTDPVCTPYRCRQGTCQLLCDECTSDADCAIAYPITGCCATCPDAFPLELVEAEPCLVRSTEEVPSECRPAACPDACELPDCVIDAQYARCVQGACLASRCGRGFFGPVCTPLTQTDLDQCSQPSDCMVVPYAHCCGATKRAINRLYLEEYNQHPEWQSFGMDDPSACATIGICRDDSRVTSATCNTTFDGPGRCELVFPPPLTGGEGGAGGTSTGAGGGAAGGGTGGGAGLPGCVATPASNGMCDGLDGDSGSVPYAYFCVVGAPMPGCVVVNAIDSGDAYCCPAAAPGFTCPDALPAWDARCAVAGSCTIPDPHPVCPTTVGCSALGSWWYSQPRHFNFTDLGDVALDEGPGCPVDAYVPECQPFGPCPQNCVSPTWEVDPGEVACASCDSGARVSRTFDCDHASWTKNGCTPWERTSTTMLVVIPFERGCGEGVVVDQVWECADAIAVDYSVHVPPGCVCADQSRTMGHVLLLPNYSRPVHAYRTLVDPGGCYP